MNIPQLRFPEFKGEWEKKKFGDFTFSSAFGPRFSSDLYSKKGNVLTLRTTDINEEGVIDYKEAPLTNLDINQFKDHILEINDLVISRSGTIGITAIFEGFKLPVIPGAFLIRFRLNNKKVFPKFIKQLFNSQKGRNKIESLSAGGVQKNLTGTSVMQMEIYLPKLLEQTKIATFLTAVDEKIQTLKKKHSLLEQYKKGIMQKLFSREMRFKDEKGNEFPEWEEKMLDEVLIKNSTKNKNQKYSLVQSVSNKHGFINQDEMFEDRRVASKDTSNYYVIEKGHFAYNPSRIDVGSLAYKYDDKISVISPLYISYKANHKYVLDAYLLNWFSSEQFIKQMNGSFEGSVRNTLSYENLIKMSISLPKEKEQDKIASFLIEIDNRIKISENEILKLETWKKGLLKKMFC